jgi:uncharacterized heparinase superfamily protein
LIDLRRLRLFIDTARYVTPSQRRARVRARTLRLMRRVFRTRFTPPDDVRIAPHVPIEVRAGQPHDGVTFRFLSHEIREPRWNEASASQLWRFHLHYFDYALDLGPAAFERLARSWMRENAGMQGDGWHPYPLSLRIVNWSRALDFFLLDSGFAEELARSIYGQTRFLFSNLEHDVRGNHLLKNIRALIWSGVMFEGDEARRWLSEGLRLLEIEVAEQVLPDGGHFERVPAYHVVVLRDLSETAEWLRLNRQTPAWLDDAVARMTRFLDGITEPGGRLPLFKDTTLDCVGQAPSPVPPAQRPGEGACPTQSGYAVFRDSHAFLIADFGPPCPPYLPAHAHADMFSFELTVDGAPLIVDSGVYEYAAGEWRDWFRSTRAHNTVEIAGENQSEVWGSFRVARRAMPGNVRFTGTTLTGEHDGYRRLDPPAIHRRTIVHIPNSAFVITDDILGTGVTEAKSYIHLHPDAKLEPWRIVSDHEIEETEGWYSERFGEKRRNRVLVLRHKGAMPFRITYTIALRNDVP